MRNRRDRLHVVKRCPRHPRHEHDRHRSGNGCVNQSLKQCACDLHGKAPFVWCGRGRWFRSCHHSIPAWEILSTIWDKSPLYRRIVRITALLFPRFAPVLLAKSEIQGRSPTLGYIASTWPARLSTPVHNLWIIAAWMGNAGPAWRAAVRSGQGVARSGGAVGRRVAGRRGRGRAMSDRQAVAAVRSGQGAAARSRPGKAARGGMVVIPRDSGRRSRPTHPINAPPACVQPD